MQQIIKQVLQQNISKKPNDGQLNGPCNFSSRQKAEAEKFKELFPSDSDLVSFFAPGNWQETLTNPEKCLKFPTVTLSVVDQLYREDLSVHIVVNNIVGLFAVTKPHDMLYKQAIEQTAQLFVGKYGRQLSVFGMLLYFADYLTEYKSTYGQFDLTDVLRQCGKVFIPSWCCRIDRLEQQQKVSEMSDKNKIVGKPALYRYLRREYVSRGIDVRTSPHVRYGILSDAEIKLVESDRVLPS